MVLLSQYLPQKLLYAISKTVLTIKEERWHSIFHVYVFFFQKKKERSLNPLAFIKDFKKIEWDNLWDIFLVRFLLGFSVLVSLSTLGSVHIEFR